MSSLKKLLEDGEFIPTRVTVPIPPTSTGGEVRGVTSEFGSTYALLGAIASKACRVRLYSTSQSIAIDAPRAINNLTIDPDVGLNLEVVFSGDGVQSLTFDPPVLATVFTGSSTWFNVSSSAGSPNVRILAYPIESQNLTREELIITRSVSSGTPVSGSVPSKKSFLILSGSANYLARLRLYSTDINVVPTAEKTRAFGTQPPAGSKLIADLMFDSATFSYKINPILEAYTWDGTNYSLGTNEVHYILENRSATSPAPLTASLQIISLED
jgi:hypothetical protein